MTEQTTRQMNDMTLNDKYESMLYELLEHVNKLEAEDYGIKEDENFNVPHQATADLVRRNVGKRKRSSNFLAR